MRNCRQNRPSLTSRHRRLCPPRQSPPPTEDAIPPSSLPSRQSKKHKHSAQQQQQQNREDDHTTHLKRLVLIEIHEVGIRTQEHTIAVLAGLGRCREF